MCECLGVCVQAGTRSLLKSLYGSVDAGGPGAVLSCSDLCVQSADVEQHAALLEGQRALRRRHACQRVVPETEGVYIKTSTHQVIRS